MKEPTILEAVEEALSDLRRFHGTEPLKVSRREMALATLADPTAGVSAKRIARRVEKETRLRKRTSARGCYHYMRRRMHIRKASKRYELINFEHRRWVKFCIQHEPCFITEDELNAIYDSQLVRSLKRWEFVKRDARKPWALGNLLIRKRDPRLGVISEQVIDCRVWFASSASCRL